MKKILFVYTIGMSLMFSCKKEASLLSSPQIQPSADSISPRFINSLIVLEQTGCPESCADYRIEVLGNGKAIYEGRANVKKTGRYERILTPLEVNTLFNKFECASFFDFRQVYSGNRPDSSLTLLTFKHRGWEKTVKEEADAPEELDELQRLIEDLHKSGNWIKLSP